MVQGLEPWCEHMAVIGRGSGEPAEVPGRQVPIHWQLGGEDLGQEAKICVPNNTSISPLTLPMIIFHRLFFLLSSLPARICGLSLLHSSS